MKNCRSGRPQTEMERVKMLIVEEDIREGRGTIHTRKQSKGGCVYLNVSSIPSLLRILNREMSLCDNFYKIILPILEWQDRKQGVRLKSMVILT